MAPAQCATAAQRDTQASIVAASGFVMSLPWCATSHSMRNWAPVPGSAYVLWSGPRQPSLAGEGDAGGGEEEGVEGGWGGGVEGGGGFCAVLVVGAGWVTTNTVEMETAAAAVAEAGVVEGVEEEEDRAVWDRVMKVVVVEEPAAAT